MMCGALPGQNILNNTSPWTPAQNAQYAALYPGSSTAAYLTKQAQPPPQKEGPAAVPTSANAGATGPSTLGQARAADPPTITSKSLLGG
jgi:hypothetical protein